MSPPSIRRLNRRASALCLAFGIPLAQADDLVQEALLRTLMQTPAELWRFAMARLPFLALEARSALSRRRLREWEWSHDLGPPIGRARRGKRKPVARCAICGSVFCPNKPGQRACSTGCGQLLKGRSRRKANAVKMCSVCERDFDVTWWRKDFCGRACSNRSRHQPNPSTASTA